MSSEVLRPGIARGPYPERAREADTALDRAAHALRGLLARRGAARHARLEAFVRAVSEAERELPGEDARFDAHVQALRQAWVRPAPGDALLARSFATVREVARRTLGTPHYDVQLMGGFVMAQGRLAEMETGEGKTLTATLPAASAALAGIPVHVVSVNDYLVERDATALRPVYERLGLSVAAVTPQLQDPSARRAAYACDVVYVTGKQLAFDYLRDRLVRARVSAGQGPAARESLLLRGLCFAIVDEADSVLVDEARTPLLLAAPARGKCIDAAFYAEALVLARALEEGGDYELRRDAGSARLRPRGRERLAGLARSRSPAWHGPRRREEWVERALAALHLYRRDRHYLVRDGAIQIVDQPTGRVLADRAWEGGLHQLVETKEGCTPTPERETLARISVQDFFRHYLKLAGMTGTAREVASELWQVYGLQTVPIPTRLPLRRQALGRRVFARHEEQWQAVVARASELHRAGRPVLLGTASVAASEELARRLCAAGLPHHVLNARQDAQEAAIVARAGDAGRITVATQMAGRGTDIRLDARALAQGGLHVVATQRAEAARIDRQLQGRCGRQGDPGSFEEILSLEDDPVRLFYPAWLLGLSKRLGRGGRPLPERVGWILTLLPQRAEERRHARLRRSLVALEGQLADLLAFAGPAT